MPEGFYTVWINASLPRFFPVLAIPIPVNTLILCFTNMLTNSVLRGFPRIPNCSSYHLNEYNVQTARVYDFLGLSPYKNPFRNNAILCLFNCISVQCYMYVYTVL